MEVLAEQRREPGGVGYRTEYVLVTGADPETRGAIVGNPDFGAVYEEVTDRIKSSGRSHMDLVLVHFEIMYFILGLHQFFSIALKS